MGHYAIELKGITKTFGNVVANDGIDLSVSYGEILALLGENGSGKTTLMNMLSGIYKPDSGSIYVNGQPVVIHSPEDAKRLGIGMVHQHFKLVENFSAADNIWIGAEGESFLLQSQRYEKIRQISEQFGFDIDPKKMVYDMAVTEKQTVEILKVLYYGARILILDEPTAVLTLQETRRLFNILRKMRDAGCAIIIITHKLSEVLELSDRVTILRKGKSVGTVKTSETNAAELTNLMVGRPVDLAIERPETGEGQPLLTVSNLSVLNEEGSYAIQDVSFTINSGEILGIAGVSGGGQKELCEAIAGLQPIAGGTIVFQGEHIEGQSPREIIKRGISMSFIPEDRLGMGLAASCSITDNMMLKSYQEPKGPFVDRKKARKMALKAIEELEIVTPGTEIPVRRLSGGNVQKVLLGREISINPTVLITAYPVRGLDINSSYTIYNILNEQKKKGVGILFIGEDLDVMLELCDRILVLCHGRVTGIVKASETTKEELGLLMVGQQADGTSHVHADSLPAEPKDDQFQPTDFLATVQATGEVAGQPGEAPAKPTRRAKSARPPLIRLVKRAEPPLWQSTLFYLGAILLALVFGGIFIALNGVNPFIYYRNVFIGCFENKVYIRGFIRLIIPLIITSLGIAVAFKMRFWNIGAEGQFIMGAIFANTAGLLMQNALQPWATILIMLVAGAVGGGLYGLIPAAAKVKFGTNETLMTLMLNYVAFYILSYMKHTMFFRKLSETGAVLRPDYRQLPEHAWLPTFQVGGLVIDISLIFALALVVILFIYLRHTKQGYEITIVGDSQRTAAYAGMNVGHIVMRTMFLSAAVIGVAGMLQVSGSATNHTISEGITSDVGWTGIIVAWLAKLNPFGILVTSILLGILEKGSAVAESALAIPAAVSDILQGIILFTVLASEFFSRYKPVFRLAARHKDS